MRSLTFLLLMMLHLSKSPDCFALTKSRLTLKKTFIIFCRNEGVILGITWDKVNKKERRILLSGSSRYDSRKILHRRTHASRSHNSRDSSPCPCVDSDENRSVRHKNRDRIFGVGVACIYYNFFSMKPLLSSYTLSTLEEGGLK